MKNDNEWINNKVLTKVRLIKAMVFPVVMYGCESWTKESSVLKN